METSRMKIATQGLAVVPYSALGEYDGQTTRYIGVGRSIRSLRLYHSYTRLQLGVMDKGNYI